jgi:hypothetical protein
MIKEKTFKQWFLKKFDWQDWNDISCYGAAGFAGFSSPRDTCALYNQFKEEIWKMLREESKSFGYKNVFEMMSSFGCANNVETCTEFENWMVFCAAERLAHQAVG